MNRGYNIKFDLQFKSNVQKNISFNKFDNNTSDFYIEVKRGGEKTESPSMVVLVVIKPDGTSDMQWIDVLEDGRLYCNLKPSLKDIVGSYQAKAMLIDGDKKTVLNNIIFYDVDDDNIISQINQDVISDERYKVLTDMISRLSAIEIKENSRITAENIRVRNENERIASFNRMNDEHTRKMSEASSKISDIEQRTQRTELNINQAIASGTQDLEVKEARTSMDGTVYDTLNERLNAIETSPYVLFETVEG